MSKEIGAKEHHLLDPLNVVCGITSYSCSLPAQCPLHTIVPSPLRRKDTMRDFWRLFSSLFDRQVVRMNQLFFENEMCNRSSLWSLNSWRRICADSVLLQKYLQDLLTWYEIKAFPALSFGRYRHQPSPSKYTLYSIGIWHARARYSRLTQRATLTI